MSHKSQYLYFAESDKIKFLFILIILSSYKYMTWVKEDIIDWVKEDIIDRFWVWDVLISKNKKNTIVGVKIKKKQLKSKWKK